MGQRPIGGRPRQSGGISNDHPVQDLDRGGSLRGDGHLGIFPGSPGSSDPGTANTFGASGKMIAMAMASGAKNHDGYSMMKDAEESAGRYRVLHGAAARCTWSQARSIRPGISTGREPKTDSIRHAPY